MRGCCLNFLRSDNHIDSLLIQAALEITDILPATIHPWLYFPSTNKLRSCPSLLKLTIHPWIRMQYLTGGEEEPEDSVLRETSQLDVTDVQGAKEQAPRV